MGYSLPPDDVTYRAFFSASCQRRKGPDDKQVRCTVVGKESDHPKWYGPTQLNRNFPGDHPVKAAIDIFGADNVRFYCGGIPEVFLDAGGQPTDAAMERLLTWSAD